MNVRDRAAQAVAIPGRTDVAANKLIRNTYTLLALTLLFSALMAGYALATNAAPMTWWLVLLGYFGLLFVTSYLRNSVWGLVSIFALTGFMGYTLGPIVGFYLGLPGGNEVVLTAFGGTAIIFLTLSGYALVSRRDFSFMGTFLMVGILVAFLAGIGAIVFSMPALALAVSAMFMLLMCGLILWQTSQLVHGGETNYIMATITLFVALYNMFLSMMHLLAAFSGARD